MQYRRREEDVYERIARHQRQLQTTGRLRVVEDEAVQVDESEVLPPETVAHIREQQLYLGGYSDW